VTAVRASQILCSALILDNDLIESNQFWNAMAFQIDEQPH